MIGITFGSDILETPPSFRMSAGTRSRAMTAQAWKKSNDWKSSQPLIQEARNLENILKGVFDF